MSASRSRSSASRSRESLSCVSASSTLTRCSNEEKSTGVADATAPATGSPGTTSRGGASTVPAHATKSIHTMGAA